MANIKKLTFLIILLIGLISVGLIASSSDQSKTGRKVYVVPISGDVEPGMAAYLERALKETQNDVDPLVVIEIDTFGGRVDAALTMVDALVNVKKGKTIAFVKTKAISAGALISLAADSLVMKHNTTIGDCAPITYSDGGPKMMGEKFQSPLRAKFRLLARLNGHPEDLAESMVTAEMEVYRLNMDGKTVYMDSRAYNDLSPEEKKKIVSKKTVVAKDELLTMTDVEAVELGFSKMSVDSIEEMLNKMAIKNYQIVRLDENWSESLVRFVTSISSILIMIGLAGVYMELKSPGFGLPGIVGIACLALVFGSQYLIGLAGYVELLIIILGIVLLGFELFVIPGFGIAGFAGISCIAIGMILTLQDFVIPDPSLPWQMDILIINLVKVLTAFFGAFILTMLSVRYLFSNLSFGPYLKTTLKESHADSKEANRAKIGDTGTALTYLRPSGKIKVNDNKFDALTEGEFLEKNTPIVITKIRGNKIIVTKRETT